MRPAHVASLASGTAPPAKPWVQASVFAVLRWRTRPMPRSPMPKRAREAGSGTATIWELALRVAPAAEKVAVMTTVSETP